MLHRYSASVWTVSGRNSEGDWWGGGRGCESSMSSRRDQVRGGKRVGGIKGEGDGCRTEGDVWARSCNGGVGHMVWLGGRGWNH